MEQEVLTLNLRDAARLTGLSAATLRRLCQQNKIKHTRLQNGQGTKNTYLIHKEALFDFLQPYEPPKDFKIYTPKKRPGRPETIRL